VRWFFLHRFECWAKFRKETPSSSSSSWITVLINNGKFHPFFSICILSCMHYPKNQHSSYMEWAFHSTKWIQRGKNVLPQDENAFQHFEDFFFLGGGDRRRREGP
jgi:hypothetical protein